MADFNPDADFELVVDDTSDGFVLEGDNVTVEAEPIPTTSANIETRSTRELEELAFEDAANPSISIEEFNQKWKGVAVKEAQDVDKEDFFNADRVEGELERFITAGKRGIGDIIGFASKALGVDQESFTKKLDEVRKEDVLSKKAHSERFGEESFDIGGTTAAIATESLVAPAKTLTTAVTEFGFSAARNQLFEDNGVDTWDKLLKVGTEVGTAVIGKKIFDAIIPNASETVKTDFGTALDKMPKAEKEVISEALQTLEDEGIDKLDDIAREKILGSLFEGKVDPEKMSSMVNTALKESRDAELTTLRNVYKDADAVARLTDDIDVSDVREKLERAIRNVKKVDGEKITSSSRKAYEDMLVALDEDDINAESIELIRRQLQGFQSGKHKDDATLFKPILDMLGEKQDELFKKSGYDVNPYLPARQADIEFKAKWEGTRKGLEETKTGGKLKTVLDKPSKTRADMDLLGRSLDRDVSERLSRELAKEPRRQMVYNIMQEGVENPHTLKGVTKIISNYEKMDAHSLTKLLGKEGANKMNGQVRALEMIKEVEALKNVPSDIKKDIVDMAAAVATLKISITGGMYRLVNKSREILGHDIATMNKNKLRLIKRVQEVKLPASQQALRKLMKTLNVTKKEMTEDFTGRASLGLTAATRDDVQTEE